MPASPETAAARAAFAAPRRADRLRSIPARLAAFALALALPILGLAGLVLWQFAAAERVRVEDGAVDTARGIAVSIDRELAGLAATLEALTLSPSLQAGNLAAFGVEAAELMRRREIVAVLRNLDGQQLVNARRSGATDLPRTPFPGTDEIALKERRPAVSGLFIGAVVQAPLFTIVSPVLRAGTDETLYLLSLSLPVERLRQIILDEGLPAGWTGALVDGADRIMARNNRHEVFVGQTATPDLIQNARGQEGTWLGRNLEGAGVFAAYARVKRSGWRVVVGVSEAELRAPLVRSLSWFAAVGSGLAALSLGLALWVGRGIVAPIRAIGERAAALGRGEPVAPLGRSFVEAEAVGAELAVASTRLAERSAERDRALAALREETHRLELLGRVGTALAGELDLDRLARAVVDAATRLTGAADGILLERGAAGDWHRVGGQGAGEDGESRPFDRFALRVADLLDPAFREDGLLQVEDAARDPRCRALAEGAPARSLMALPLTRSGVTLGALVFGHPEPARFGERELRLVAGLAGQAAAALDNARLFRSVQREQERFGAAVRAVRGVLWTNDAEGRMRPPQPGWAALTGQSEAEYQGYGWADAVHPDDAGPTVEEWRRCLAARKPFVFEHRVRRRDGAWGTFAIRAVPVIDEGAVREWVGVHTDITEQRKAEAELRESNEELQRYAYIVSHDLRAPLVNVMGFTSEIDATREDIRAALAGSPQAERIDGDLAESLGFIKAAITRMDGLINAILQLSRQGRRRFEPVPLDMTALVRGLADAQRHQAEAAGATVEVGDLPPVTADRLAVEQVLGNLLDNAVKYLDPARPGRVTVSGAIVGPNVRYAVADNGRGIAASDHARVFELFRRAGAQDRPGEGIGLAHVRTLVRALGGRIELDSEPGVGTTFAVTLPRTPQGQDPGGHAAPAEPAGIHGIDTGEGVR